MMRSLFSGVSGIKVHQTRMDVIGNNISNVNTTGFKSSRVTFTDMLSQNLQGASSPNDNIGGTNPKQIGLGSSVGAVDLLFTNGSVQSTGVNTDLALSSTNALFILNTGSGTAYTRNGDFIWAIGNNANSITLTTSEGFHVLDTQGRPIVLGEQYMPANISVTQDGELCYPDEANNPQPIGITIGVYQFNNPNGLEKLAESRYAQTAASGEAINEATNDYVEKTKVIQGYLEGSNVQVVDEMVNMIVAQRAYEMNSKAITTSDEMLQQANNLKR